MSLSTHVLDASTGHPAVGVAVTLTDDAGVVLGAAETDDDGRVRELAAELPTGYYRLTFDTAAYFSGRQVGAFYPEVLIAFEVLDPLEHYHVPLLLSPYAYSTYRGS